MQRRLAEHHGAMTVEKNAVLNVVAHRPGQHEGFDITANLGQVVRAERMIHPLDVLLDDWALIEVSRDIVRGGADDFDAAVMRLVIRLGTLEAGQKAMVNVDGTAL